jgi:hypothetical protein
VTKSSTILRITTAALATAALLALPAPALAESALVQAGVFTAEADAGQVDTLTISDGTGANAGKIIVEETTSPSALPGTGCTVIGFPTIACTGATSADVKTLDMDDVVTVTAAALPSRIDSGAGNDIVNGSPSADDILGGGGNDELHGGAGADKINGGGNEDRIFARDGAVDDIDCGHGTDEAEVDANDTVKGCETVSAPLVPPIEPVTQPVVDQPKKDIAEPAKDNGPAGGPGKAKELAPRAIEDPLPPVSPVGLVARPVKVGRDGTAPLEITCPVTEVAGCRGTVYLDPAPAAKKARRGKKGKGKNVKARMARRGRFGRSPFQIAAGKKGKVKVKLSASARAKLGLPKPRKARAARRGRRVRAVVTVVQKGHSRRSIVELRG